MTQPSQSDTQARLIAARDKAAAVAAEMEQTLPEQSNSLTGLCPGCGDPLPPSRGNAPRKWCSERCRKMQYRRPCANCGAPCGGSDLSTYCADCGLRIGLARSRALQHAQVAEKRDLVLALLADGATNREIAERAGTTLGAIGVFVNRLRRYGYDVRRPPGRGRRYTFPRPEVHVSTQRQHRVEP
jgi:RNA polymerase-binding transcription factor DksA